VVLVERCGIDDHSCHVVLIVVAPWPGKSFPAPELWPVRIVDFAAVCGFIKVVGKAMNRSHGSGSLT